MLLALRRPKLSVTQHASCTVTPSCSSTGPPDTATSSSSNGSSSRLSQVGPGYHPAKMKAMSSPAAARIPSLHAQAKVAFVAVNLLQP